MCPLHIFQQRKDSGIFQSFCDLEDVRFLLDFFTSLCEVHKHSSILFFLGFRSFLDFPENSASESFQVYFHLFCDVFDDCTLWNGIGRDLMLVGTRGASQRVTREHFARQWHDPTLADELAGLGFEHPEQLGALFIGGASYLKALSAEALPLVDDYPKRIHGPIPDLNQLEPMYLTWTDTDRARERFLSDPFIESLWPEDLRESTRPFFDSQRIINTLSFGLRPTNRSLAHDAMEILTQTELVAPVMWLLGTNADFYEIAKAARGPARENPDLDFHLGAALVAQRRYESALAPLARSERNPNNFTLATSVRVLALCAAGRMEEANALARARRDRMVAGPRLDDFFEVLGELCREAPVNVAYLDRERLPVGGAMHPTRSSKPSRGRDESLSP